ncbi:hypothetical protein C8Q77DRAFT_1075341 [Trametes polyzona]|nr:hypothetical protein C8Q77DRAFT_1075341 [Trametes polyzona]
MRTRPGLKSCLKITPPITPDLSAASSPCGSGRTSPDQTSDGGSSVGSCGRKTVSFCSENELEEVFWADEWDRSPAAVTPKLSYQDILELKQLRISLPYSPPPPPPRQPFTTSLPSSAAGPSNKPPFPVSRFASGPSHTPSKWRNRSQPTDLDPEILPYLDAVPIRLLPLLPQSPPPEPTPQESHPQTPTPTASPERRPAPPPPTEPPEIQIDPPVPAPVSPPSPVQARKPNFAFLPLLPVQDPTSVPEQPPTQSSGPIRPKRMFNMTFVPVNAVHEGESAAPSSEASGPHTGDTAKGISSSAPLPSSSTSPSPLPTSAPISSPTHHWPRSSPPMSPPTHSFSLPMPLRPTASMESDNETDTTDTCVSDTDGESDAPSTSTFGSSMPSPPLDDLDVEARLEAIKLGPYEPDDEQTGHVPRIHTQDPGSYFPPVSLSNTAPLPIPIPAHTQAEDSPPALPSGPGQTPPLSVLYPSPTSQHQPLLPLDSLSSASGPSIPSSHPEPPSCNSAEPAPAPDVPSIPTIPSLPLSVITAHGQDSLPSTPLAMSLAFKKKLTLEALPSPALVPPSPFELDPLDTIGASPTPAPLNPQLQSKLNTLAASAENVADESAANPHPSALATPGESPMLTLETMRSAWDAKARVGLGLGPEADVAGARALAPSLSRRRSS